MEIISGDFGDPAMVRDYRAERLGDTLIERIVWGEMPAPRRLRGETVADAGFIWFRFWLSAHDQIVERYYDREAQPIGAQIDICMPLTCDENGCRTVDLILDIWISADGQVTVHKEDAFDRAVLDGDLDATQAERAEKQLRSLTAAIARNRFPPPLVRHWQPDLSRIAEDPREGAEMLAKS